MGEGVFSVYLELDLHMAAIGLASRSHHDLETLPSNILSVGGELIFGFRECPVPRSYKI